MVNLDYMYNPEASKKSFAKNFFVDKKLGFKVIENGMILPHRDKIKGLVTPWGGFGGIIDSNGEFVKDSFCMPNVMSGYTPSQESIQYSSETIVYVGMFIPVWGHFISDSLRLMWFLNSETFYREFKDCRIAYIPWIGFPLEQHPDFARVLEIVGLDFDRLQPITQPTKFDKIILPDSSFVSTARYFTNEYRETIDRIRNFALKNRMPISNKKLYFLHGNNKQIGEERIAEYFKSKGFDVITHQKRTASFDDTINLLINCEVFAAPMGSCGVNSIFTNNGTEIISIPRAFMQFPPQNAMFDQVNLFNTTYIDSTMAIFNVKISSGYCYVISQQLKEFFGDKWTGYEEGDFKTFLDYANSASLREGREINPSHLEGYGAIIQDFMAQLKRRKDLIAAYNMPPDWDKFKAQLNYVTWVYKKSWGDNWQNENQPSNPLDQELEISAIQFRHPAHKIYYSVYYDEKEGWTEEVSNNNWAGVTSGKKPIYGMRVRLDEAGAKEFDILYRMHKFDGEWTPWAKNGEELYSHDVKLNAIQIKLEPVKSAEADIKKIDDIKPAEATNKFDYTQTALLKSDEIYLQGQRQRQRQNLT